MLVPETFTVHLPGWQLSSDGQVITVTEDFTDMSLHHYARIWKRNKNVRMESIIKLTLRNIPRQL
jgi:hypothetical protein